MHATHSANEVALTQVGYGFLLKRMGKPDEARRRFTDALSAFDRLSTPGQFV